MLYLIHEMDIDYLIVNEVINNKIVWLQWHAKNRIQTYDVNCLNLANNMLNYLRLVPVGLCILYHLKPLHV
jgi:hypothetical protein